jgi:alkylglycerol monooxygenase
MQFTIYILVAFVVLVAAEGAYLRRKGRAYSLNTSVSNISCGVLSLCTRVFYTAGFVVIYGALESRVGMTRSFGWQWWSLILTFVLIDLCYYTYHRMAHRVALLWGAHVVHHQSDEYNLTVSLRQDSVGVLASTPFYLVPALIGIPLPVFVAMDALYQLYQFFVHTALVRNMGWLEHVISTPRLHSLHHARNTEYIDCNYSGFLLVWDKVFGTYRPPSVEPLFGVTEPIPTWSPLWANFGYFKELYVRVRSRRGWNRIYTLIGPPEWRPAMEPQQERTPYVVYANEPKPGWLAPAMIVFAVSIALSFVLTAKTNHWDTPTNVTVALSAVMASLVATRLFDGKGRIAGSVEK